MRHLAAVLGARGARAQAQAPQRASRASRSRTASTAWSRRWAASERLARFRRRASRRAGSVENVSAGGFGALVPQAKSDWLKVGALVAAQPEGGANWVVGTVRRVSKVSAQEMRVGVETLSRTPGGVAASRCAAPAQAQGVLLPRRPSAGDASHRAARRRLRARREPRGRRIGGRQHVYMPQGVAERGEDYEIVTLQGDGQRILDAGSREMSRDLLGAHRVRHRIVVPLHRVAQLAPAASRELRRAVDRDDVVEAARAP